MRSSKNGSEACLGFKEKIEGFLVVAQVIGHLKRNYQMCQRKRKSRDCRVCCGWEETINYIISGCPVLAKKDVIHTHNIVGTYVNTME